MTTCRARGVLGILGDGALRARLAADKGAGWPLPSQRLGALLSGVRAATPAE